ncbi:hypothetical protein EBR96_04180, partial [bacterium]|nr:hypothetical protein [bacterium]
MISSPSAHFDSGLASLVIISRFHGIAVDADQIRHEFQPPNSLLSVR